MVGFLPGSASASNPQVAKQGWPFATRQSKRFKSWSARTTLLVLTINPFNRVVRDAQRATSSTRPYNTPSRRDITSCEESLPHSPTPHVYDLRTQTCPQPYAVHQAVQKLLTSTLTLSPDSPTPIITDKLIFEADKTLAEVAVIYLLQRQDTCECTCRVGLTFEKLEKQTEAIGYFQSSFHLSISRLIVEFASRKRSFARGRFIGALTVPDTTPRTLGRPVSRIRIRPPTKSVREALKGVVGRGKRSFRDVALNSRSYYELFVSKYIESGGNPGRGCSLRLLLRSIRGFGLERGIASVCRESDRLACGGGAVIAISVSWTKLAILDTGP
ncbi:hypothetical protein CC2G_011321 [Coprinopsis cinerea AmutBmut pab1-1]|nr:hypothetical protein CC2G_011321 [Coprinopsis cinerea AmutBmut pab1-1]